MQLALKLGYASPGRMLSEMRPGELGLWRALWEDDPWSEDRADLRAGEIAATVANYAGKVRAQGEPARPIDFMRFLRRRHNLDGSNEGTLMDKFRSFLMDRPRKG